MGRPRKNLVLKQEKPERKKREKKEKADNFFEDLVAVTENKLAQAASNGVLSGDINSWIDTGVYKLNAQLSGSLHGGCPDNKIVVFAGPEATGKTFFVLSLADYFLENNPKGAVIYFETESAIDKQMLELRGLDTRRIFVVPVSTIQEFRTQALKILRKYEELSVSERRPMMFVLDSLGMLSTTKEMTDSESGSDTKDMTRAGLVKAAFRTLTLKLGVLNVPLFCTNHTYEEMGKMFAQKKMSGGSGISYANSITVFLSKRKEKESGEVTGCIITCTLKKGRKTKENTVIEVKLDYRKGLDKYFGLLELLAEAKVVKKLDKKYEFPDGTKAFEKEILNDPETYFTPDIMVELEKIVAQKYSYGVRDIEIDDETLEEEVSDEPQTEE